MNQLASQDDLSALVRQVTELLGRVARVYKRQAAVEEVAEGQAAPSPSVPSNEAGGEVGGGDEDSIYDFTAADYARLMASRKEELYLKPRAIQEREKEARRSRIKHAVVRVRFPDDWVLESTFAATETVEAVRHFVQKALAPADIPFHFYVTPPKERIRDEVQSLYDAGLAPGGLIYFVPDSAIPHGVGEEGQHQADAVLESEWLRPEVLRIKDAHLRNSAEQTSGAELEQPKPVESPQPVSTAPVQKSKELRGKPKWFK